MKLYEISDQYLACLDAATDPDSDLPTDVFADTLEGIEGEAKDKLQAVIGYALNQKAEGEAIEEAVRKMQGRAKSKKNSAQSLLDYALINMRKLGLTQLECAQFAARIQKNPPGVEVFDESVLPDEFKSQVIEVKIDKKSIAEQIKLGKTIPGAALKVSESLRIR